MAGDYPFIIASGNGAIFVATRAIGASHSVKLEELASSIEPGTAMIFNGTEWTLQSGYGYVTAGGVQTFDKKFIPASTPANVFDADDDTPLSEIAEAYEKYGAVYLKINQYAIGTGVPYFSKHGLARFEFPTKSYTLNGASGNSTINLEFRFYADGTGFTDRSDPQIYKIPLTWAGQ